MRYFDFLKKQSTLTRPPVALNYAFCITCTLWAAVPIKKTKLNSLYTSKELSSFFCRLDTVSRLLSFQLMLVPYLIYNVRNSLTYGKETGAKPPCINVVQSLRRFPEVSLTGRSFDFAGGDAGEDLKYLQGYRVRGLDNPQHFSRQDIYIIHLPLHLAGKESS